MWYCGRPIKTYVFNYLFNKSSAFCDGKRRYTAYQYFFRAAGKFCENELKACGLDASITQHVFVSKKH